MTALAAALASRAAPPGPTSRPRLFLDKCLAADAVTLLVFCRDGAAVRVLQGRNGAGAGTGRPVGAGATLSRPELPLVAAATDPAAAAAATTTASPDPTATAPHPAARVRQPAAAVRRRAGAERAHVARGVAVPAVCARRAAHANDAHDAHDAAPRRRSGRRPGVGTADASATAAVTVCGAAAGAVWAVLPRAAGAVAAAQPRAAQPGH